MRIIKTKPELSQAKMNAWQKKAMLINEYYNEAGNISRVRKQFRQSMAASSEKCEWCDRFQEVSCLSCLNCGRYFKDDP